MGWLRQQEPTVLLVMLLVIVGIWAFIELADEVLEQDTERFDHWAMHLLRQPGRPELPRGPLWLAETGRDITALGSVVVLSFIITAVAGYLWFQRQYRSMCLVLVASVSGMLLSSLLKLFFARQRPDLVPLAQTMSPSFPSGHSMLSAVVYLSLGALLAQRESSRPIKVYFLGLALSLAFLVGISRVYLGLHYPTDVLAGWSVGLVWALLWWLIARYLRH
jgi:undecaprenyl-diphosphatase